ncbi:hypothetical protein QYE76_055766 [Lolium multiflorum]|uniref:Integrase catalytic domain-containing protein n=1 Tax=Lolium multiflorum TaxID=4521 RepID=A0AAD8T0Z6_LOLMU|nr:hypothetical protein QYE76_055766 [Lolium multiflorum]
MCGADGKGARQKAGKQLKKRHPIKSIVTTSKPLELLHLDLFGPSHYDTLGGSKYGLVIVDDYSRYSWVFLLKSKDETHREFIIFAKKAQRMYESEIKAIRTDNGTEFKNYTMQEFVDDEGIKHEFSAPYTPQQNGVVERKNRTIIEMARTMLSEFNSPHNFWGEAISTAVHYSNRLFLCPLHNKTPYELLTGNKPNVMYIRVFGCKCLVKNNKGKLGKFETRTIEGTFVGYAENSHAYRYYNKSTGTIEVSCDVVFLEDNGSQVEQVVSCVAGNDDDPSSAIKLMGIGHIRPIEVHNDDQDDGIEMSHIPKNNKKALTPLSKIMMVIKKHPQLMIKLKLSLMIMKFEMSMMGELKFFLGFQVRQLAKGTFISQEKYVKDMLKKFNMTNASPMKTPMPVKGQLGSCDGEKDVDIKDTGPGGSARGRGKSFAKRKKDKHATQDDDLIERVPTFNVGTAHIANWRRAREANPYRFKEQTYTGGDRLFWTNTQVSLWDDFYNSRECMKNGIIVMTKAINKEALTMHQATKYRFVVDTLKDMGLYDLVCLKPGDEQGVGYYCPILVRQFHCTVFFHDDPARTMTWMTGKDKYSCNYLDFCEAMGFGGGRAHGFKIYSQDKFSHGDITFCYPSYCRPENMRTIDGCDLLYYELRHSVRDRMTPNYAQYIQQLINKVVPSPNNKKDQLIKMEPFKFPKQGDRSEIPAMMPSERRSKERHDPAASSSYSRRPKRGASRFLTSLWQMCKNTNDVAHQSLALNQETRRRQNEFMAARNNPVPPPGPEMEPVIAPSWEMPPIHDEMFQNFDLSMYAHGGLPPRFAQDPDTSGNREADDEDNEEYDDEDGEGDDDEDDDDGSPPAGTEFY